MKAQLIIPIEPGPRLTPDELNAFVEVCTARGVDPNERLAALVRDAIAAESQNPNGGARRETALAA